jgi:hypothetical protein
VNVVSDACSIFSSIIVPENAKFFPLFDDYFLDKGEKVVWILKRLISQEVGLMSATRIEVS